MHRRPPPSPHPVTIGQDTTEPSADRLADALADRPQAFFNALLTEHFVLQSVRGTTVSEAGSRASLYLATLSGSLVGFGFLADTTYATGFLTVVLPIIVVLGVFTYVRLVETSLEDVAALAAIQRIRGLYATLLPGAGRYLPMPTGPHAPNELLPIGPRTPWRGVFFTMSSAIAIVNSVVAGAGIAMSAAAADAGTGAVLGTGAAAALMFAVVHGLYQERRYHRLPSVLPGVEEQGGP